MLYSRSEFVYLAGIEHLSLGSTTFLALWSCRGGLCLKSSLLLVSVCTGVLLKSINTVIANSAVLSFQYLKFIRELVHTGVSNGSG